MTKLEYLNKVGLRMSNLLWDPDSESDDDFIDQVECIIDMFANINNLDEDGIDV